MCTYVDNLKHGCVEQYYDCTEFQQQGSTGVLFKKYSCINGKKHGLYQERYPTNQLKVECNYEQGLLHGRYRSMFCNGITQIDCVYELGNSVGEVVEYDFAGQVLVG